MYLTHSTCLGTEHLWRVLSERIHIVKLSSLKETSPEYATEGLELKLQYLAT